MIPSLQLVQQNSKITLNEYFVKINISFSVRSIHTFPPPRPPARDVIPLVSALLFTPVELLCCALFLTAYCCLLFVCKCSTTAQTMSVSPYTVRVSQHPNICLQYSLFCRTTDIIRCFNVFNQKKHRNSQWKISMCILYKYYS